MLKLNWSSVSPHAAIGCAVMTCVLLLSSLVPAHAQCAAILDVSAKLACYEKTSLLKPSANQAPPAKRAEAARQNYAHLLVRMASDEGILLRTPSDQLNESNKALILSGSLDRARVDYIQSKLKIIEQARKLGFERVQFSSTHPRKGSWVFDLRRSPSCFDGLCY